MSGFYSQVTAPSISLVTRTRTNVINGERLGLMTATWKMAELSDLYVSTSTYHGYPEAISLPPILNPSIESATPFRTITQG